MTNHISKACFKNQDRQKPATQQGNQRAATNTNNSNSNLAMQDQTEIQKGNSTSSNEEQDTIAFAGIIKDMPCGINWKQVKHYESQSALWYILAYSRK